MLSGDRTRSTKKGEKAKKEDSRETFNQKKGRGKGAY